MFHPFLPVRHANEKTHPWPARAPNGFTALAMNVDLRARTKFWRSSPRRRRLRGTVSLHTYLRGTGLCLSLVRLVNLTRAPFLSGRRTIGAQPHRSKEVTDRGACDDV